MKPDTYISLSPRADEPPRIIRIRNGKQEKVPLAAFSGKGITGAVAFAPSPAVGRFRAVVPARSDAEAQRAALYAIEDELAQPVEDVCLTLGARDPVSGERDLYVVDRQLMDAWRTQLGALGLGEAQVIAENSLAPAQPVAYDFGDRLLLFGAGGVCSADTTLPDDAIAALTDAAGLNGAQAVRADALATCIALHERKPGVSLNGAGGRPARNTSRAMRGWMFAGTLLGAAAVIWLATVWLETRNLAAETRANRDAARAAYALHFPAAPVPSDIDAEVRRLAMRAADRRASGFLPLTSALYDALAGSETIQLKRLTYNAGEKAVRADLQFANRADETAFRARAEAAGWQVETERAVDGPAGVDASIILRGR